MISWELYHSVWHFWVDDSMMVRTSQTWWEMWWFPRCSVSQKRMLDVSPLEIGWKYQPFLCWNSSSLRWTRYDFCSHSWWCYGKNPLRKSLPGLDIPDGLHHHERIPSIFLSYRGNENLCLLNELPSSRHGRLQGRFLWRQRQFIFAPDTDTWAGAVGCFLSQKVVWIYPSLQANPGKRSEVIPEIGTRSPQNGCLKLWWRDAFGAVLWKRWRGGVEIVAGSRLLTSYLIVFDVLKTHWWMMMDDLLCICCCFFWGGCISRIKRMSIWAGVVINTPTQRIRG